MTTPKIDPLSIEKILREVVGLWHGETNSRRMSWAVTPRCRRKQLVSLDRGERRDLARRIAEYVEAECSRRIKKHRLLSMEPGP